MYKRILVPLDGSKLAEIALPHAESLAQQYNAELVLLQVVQPPTIPGQGSTELILYQKTMESLIKKTEDYLAGLKGEFREKSITTRTRVGLGPVVDEIVETADAQDAELVIIASHGRSGLGRVFFGSVASGVLNRIEHPLLIIRCPEVS